ncbi:MAG: endopeptidase La [Ruminococcaceae bacterium]|nr:endopeptidase La [Oscillospiraceae bacterium]
MARLIEKAEKLTLPVIPLRGLVAFPALPMNFELERSISKKACAAASHSDMYAFLVTQRDIQVDDPERSDLYDVGCVVRIKQTFNKNPEGNIRIVTEGLCRGTLLSIDKSNGYLTAEVMSKTLTGDFNAPDVTVEALNREILGALDDILRFLPPVSDDFMLTVNSLKNPGMLADFIASSILVRLEDKQAILDIFDPIQRGEALISIIDSEIRLLETEMDIHRKVKEAIDDHQRDYYLREQLKVIQTELGNDFGDDAESYIEKIENTTLPEEVREKLMREVNRMAKMPFGSPESALLRNYLDTCLEIPWDKTTKDRADVEAARKILDADHDGLTKIKERILEFIAVKQLNPGLKNQIICFAGPPGVGKTSLGASIARAMKRKYVRVSLGGIRDESDIRGHRKTYIGSMPGRIINALIQCGSMNPVVLLDEVDKMCGDAHGDPSSALLEVLDSEQNKAFRDHFVEIPVDLSECFFIATANNLSTVPRPLLDRMEIIELNTYTPNEKLAIAKNHLIPKQMKNHGLNKRMLKIADDAIRELISGYTRESGVRTLEREIASLCRKAAKKMVEEGTKSVSVTAKNLKDLLGERKFIDESMSESGEVGVTNGLAYTEVGGDVLKVEAIVMEGSGKIELTGTLGDVMKESARLAVSYIRAHAAELGIAPDFHKTKDIHIHVPEGAVPKDGPSAGVTLTTSLVSALTGIPVRHNIAMTGEITLTGRVLAIGGLREKSTAAYTMGVRRILIPKDNVRDLKDIDNAVREEVEFIPVSNIAEVLELALVKKAEKHIPAGDITAEKASSQPIYNIPVNEPVYGTI